MTWNHQDVKLGLWHLHDIYTLSYTFLTTP
jgi:hypothetical protein